jgi:hypothetical protein
LIWAEGRSYAFAFKAIMEVTYSPAFKLTVRMRAVIKIQYANGSIAAKETHDLLKIRSFFHVDAGAGLEWPALPDCQLEGRSAYINTTTHR